MTAHPIVTPSTGRPGGSSSLPLVIAHRGASGYRPEHTIEAYRLAVELGADAIEPDFVATRDHVLVARHENELSATTDVASRAEFADRRTVKVVDGRAVPGWFTEDFTLHELKTLRVSERRGDLRGVNTVHDGRWDIPTFDEILDLAEIESSRAGRRIGVCAEIKHPSYFRSLGLPLETAVAATARARGLDGADSPLSVQSFEPGSLRSLRAMVDVRLVQLVAASGRPWDSRVGSTPRTYDDMLTPAGLREVSTYADGIGVDKRRILPTDAEGCLLTPTSLVDDAHSAGLRVLAWTFRSENFFLPPELRRGDDDTAYGDALGEYARFFSLGVDGVISDHPDAAVTAREALLAHRP